MSQYNAGTVAVTNGSATITGTSTSWLANINVGDGFTIEASGVTYDVAAVVSDTNITLSAPYAGATAANQYYAIIRDFTAVMGLPYPAQGDQETATVVKAALQKLDGTAMFAASREAANGVAGLDANSEVIKPQAGAWQEATAGRPYSVKLADGTWGVGISTGGIGNVNDPLVHIPFRRANDEVRLSGTQTFTRASTGTYIDPLDGLVKTAAINTPRFERMADGGVGVLLEGASTNLLLQSDDLTATPWGIVGTAPTLTTNSADVVDIYGTNTATKIVFAATAGGARQTIAVTTGTTYTPNIWLRTLSGSVSMQFRDGAQVLQNITVTSTWQRFDFPGAAATISHNFDLYDPAGNSGTIYACAGQFEQLPFASSYIPTTTAAVTRVEDSLSVPMAGNSFGRNASYSLMFDTDIGNNVYSSVGTGIHPVVGMYLNRRIQGNAFSYTFLGGAGWPPNGPSSGIGFNSLNGRFTDVVDAASNSIRHYDDGMLVESLPYTPPTNVTIVSSIRFIANGGGSSWSGHIRNFRIYDRALTASEVASA